MSNLYNRIEMLCQKNSVTITDMCKISGASRGSLTDLKMGRINTLKAETMKKIADYFGVSIDFLLTGEEQKEKGPVTSTGALRDYFYKKTGRDPTSNELERIDEFADTFIKGLDK